MGADGQTTRSEPQAFRARELSLSITAGDLEKSVAWYCDQVGFHLHQRWETDGELQGVELVAGDVHIMLSRDDGAKGTDRKKGQGMRIWLTTAQDLDQVAADIQARGGTLESPPADMPWGGRAFHLVDPDGFKISIASEQ